VTSNTTPIPRQRILVAYSAADAHVSTTRHYLNALQLVENYDVSYLNVVGVSDLVFDLSCFDVVFVNYCARLTHEGYVAPVFLDALRAWRGIKILSVQDEYDRTNILKAKISELGFDIVLTCLTDELLPKIYPKSAFPKVQFHQVLAGYVPEMSSNLETYCLPLKERHIVLGYRGRDIGPRYGILAHNKYEIGIKMRQFCAERGIAHDIEVDEEHRIYGEDWYRFIGSCRAMLGSESGSNVFDFDGAIEEKYRAMARASHGKRPSYAQFLPLVAKAEAGISMGQISPRIFECVSQRTALVLLPGSYSGIIQAGVHYIQLEADYSNAHQVLADLANDELIEAMTQRAWQDLIASGRYSYQCFADQLERLISTAAKERAVKPHFAPATEAINVTPSKHQISQKGDVIEFVTPQPLATQATHMRVLAAQAADFLREGNRLCGLLKEVLQAPVFLDMERWPWLPQQVVKLGADQDNGTLWPKLSVTEKCNSKRHAALLALQTDCEAWFEAWKGSDIVGLGVFEYKGDAELLAAITLSLTQHKARCDLLRGHVNGLKAIKNGAGLLGPLRQGIRYVYKALRSGGN
jgi:hypothetical protein